MAVDAPQLKGHIRFGMSPDSLTDYSGEIAQLTLNQQLQTTTRPKTFADPSEQQRKSGEVDSVTIQFFHDEAEAAGFWRAVWQARKDDTTTANGRKPGELYFAARFKPGPADPVTNPEFGGWVLCSDLDTGGVVGEFKNQTKTWPARDVVELTADDEES